MKRSTQYALALVAGITAAGSFTSVASAGENDVRAVLTVKGVSDGGVNTTEIKGLKDAQTCLNLGRVAAFNRGYSNSNVSCLQNGEIIAAQVCDDNGKCKPISLDK